MALCLGCHGSSWAQAQGQAELRGQAQAQAGLKVRLGPGLISGCTRLAQAHSQAEVQDQTQAEVQAQTPPQITAQTQVKNGLSLQPIRLSMGPTLRRRYGLG